MNLLTLISDRTDQMSLRTVKPIRFKRMLDVPLVLALIVSFQQTKGSSKRVKTGNEGR
jgi:hypothetical protein